MPLGRTIVGICVCLAAAAAAALMARADDADSVLQRLLNDQSLLNPLQLGSGSFIEPLLRPRPSGSEAASEVLSHLRVTLQANGWATEVDAFESETPLGPIRFANLVATLPVEAESYMVLAAHYDSKLDPPGFVGAIDSAVPCGLLLYLAQTLSTLTNSTAWRPRRGVRLVFFDGEEAVREWSAADSLYGSRHLASQWESTVVEASHAVPRMAQRHMSLLSQIDILVLLDLLGTAHPRVPSFFASTHSAYKQLAAAATTLHARNQLPRDVAADEWFPDGGTASISGRAWHVADDHIPFVQRGVAALHVIPAPFPDVWHTMEVGPVWVTADI